MLLTWLNIAKFFVDREEKTSSHDLHRENDKFLHPKGRMRTKFCIFLEIYESEMRDAQVDGSLHL